MENKSDIVSENLVCTGINFRCTQKISVIEVFQQLNMYVYCTYLITYYLFFLLFSLVLEVKGRAPCDEQEEFKARETN